MTNVIGILALALVTTLAIWVLYMLGKNAGKRPSMVPPPPESPDIPRPRTLAEGIVGEVTEEEAKALLSLQDNEYALRKVHMEMVRELSDMYAKQLVVLARERGEAWEAIGKRLGISTRSAPGYSYTMLADGRQVILKGNHNEYPELAEKREETDELPEPDEG